MKRTIPALVPMGLSLGITLPAQAQTPAIRAADDVLNGASYAFSGLPNGGMVLPGSFTMM
jgi:hypothetical protein